MGERESVALIAHPSRSLIDIERDVVNKRNELYMIERDIGSMQEVAEKVGDELSLLRREFSAVCDEIYPGIASPLNHRRR